MDKATPDYLRGERSETTGNTEEVAKASPDYLRGERREERGNTVRRWIRQHQII